MKHRIALAVGLGAVASASPGVASVDTSPKPGGVYRLKPGTYVEKGVDCSTAPNAAILRYDGRGLSGAHSRACRVQVLSHRGSKYVVSQSCIDAGAGPAPRTEEKQTVTVRDALDFTLRARGSERAFRYCPSYMLPKGVR